MSDLDFLKRATDAVNQATDELKRDNDSALKKKKQKPCYCDAYLRKDGTSFPHRKYGGKCEGFDPEAGDEEAADRWLLRLMYRG